MTLRPSGQWGDTPVGNSMPCAVWKTQGVVNASLTRIV